MREALLALEDASRRDVSARDQKRLDSLYRQALANYEVLAAI